MIDLVNSAGRRVPLGKKLGTGGEGSVYEVPEFGHGIVAKIYHEPVSPEKQAKLRAMVKAGDESLRKIAAWPTETLHMGTGGQIRGFLMPKVAGCAEIHVLYGPSHRKQRYPDIDWAFLVNTARNTASAFDAVHRLGHIIGDVNPKLVFVAGNSTVRLIDCDSFQIFADGKHYLCEVGMPHFTPPELQCHSSYRGVLRTKNHDNFGLALLVFHTLLMGRHPFSGVFSGAGDMPLEKSIEQFRYAFGRSAASKGMTPPPNSVTPAILPESVAQLFERAFTERSAQPEGRPTARDWVAVLDSLKGQLRTCGQDPVHKYFGGLSICPWCLQEQQSGNYFFIAIATATAGLSSFSLGQVWAQIMNIESPGSAPQIDPSSFLATPKPLPADLTGFFAFLRVNRRAEERQKRQHTLFAAQQRFSDLQKQWQYEVGDSVFQSALRELARLRAQYEGLANELTQQKQRLQQELRNNQLHRFLDRFFIEDCNIPGVGPTRKAVLSSFGIETAAHVNANRVISIPGFGQKLTRDLVAWRNGLERRFVFDPSKGVDVADIAALNQRFGQKRKEIEGKLQGGPEHLNQVRGQILRQRAQMFPIIRDAAQQVAQAKADLAVMG